MKTVVLWSISTAALALAGYALAADEASLTFDHARADPHEPDRKDTRKYWTLSIGFTKPIKDTDVAVGRTGFKIFDAATGEDVTVVRIEPGPSTATDFPKAFHDSTATQAFEVYLAPEQLDSTHSYMLVAVGFQAAGKPLAAVATDLTFPATKAGKAQAPEKSNSSKPGVELSKAKSDIYLSGELDLVSEAPAGTRSVNGIADIKLSYPYITRFPLFTTSVHDQIFSPLFTLNASSLKNHDPNAMSFGMGWASVLGFANLELQQNFLLESTKNFSVADGVYSPSLHVPVKDIPLSKHTRLYFTPFVGAEFGGNFESPLPQAQGAPVARGVFGSDLTTFFQLPQKSAIKGIGFDAQWMRRILAEDELSVNATNPSDLQLMRFGRSPRDHATANLKLALTDSLSFTVGYEWGELPPSYQMVHNLVKIGLLYQAQVKPH